MNSSLAAMKAISPFKIVKSLSPLQADVIKTIALAAMLSDHVNIILLGGRSEFLYAFGHAAFPLFTLLWAINLPSDLAGLRERTRRLWVWAFATQPLFWLAFMMNGQSWMALNILFAYAGCTQLLYWAKRWGINGAMAGTSLLLIVAWPLTPASYGVTGILFCLMCLAGRYHAGLAENGVYLFAVFIAMGWLNMPPVISGWWADALTFDFIPTLAIPLLVICVVSVLPGISARRIWPRRFFYHAYAAHLTLLGVLAVLPGKF